MIERYTLPRMKRIWNEENKFRKMADVEVLACEAMAKYGLIPKKSYSKIKRRAKFSVERIKELDGFELAFPDTPFVREFAVRAPEDPRAILQRGLERGVLAGVRLARFPDLDVEDGLLLAFTEKRNREEIDLLLEVLAGN